MFDFEPTTVGRESRHVDFMIYLLVRHSQRPQYTRPSITPTAKHADARHDAHTRPLLHMMIHAARAPHKRLQLIDGGCCAHTITIPKESKPVSSGHVPNASITLGTAQSLTACRYHRPTQKKKNRKNTKTASPERGSAILADFSMVVLRATPPNSKGRNRLTEYFRW